MKYMKILQKASEEVQKAADEQNRAAFDEAWTKYGKLLKQFGFKKEMRSQLNGRAGASKAHQIGVQVPSSASASK